MLMEPTTIETIPAARIKRQMGAPTDPIEYASWFRHASAKNPMIAIVIPRGTKPESVPKCDHFLLI